MECGKGVSAWTWRDQDTNSTPMQARLIQMGGDDTLGDWTAEVYEEAYLKDPDLREIYILVKQGMEQIPWMAMGGQSQASKNYWVQWERLSVSGGRLYRD